MPVFVVTGCSSGIGLEVCRQLVARGDQVYATVRKSNAELEAVGVTKIVSGVDVTDKACTELLQKELAGVSIDCLVNNAGGLGAHQSDQGWGEMVENGGLGANTEELIDGMRAAMELNAYGTLRVTKALLSLMAPGGKVAIISSQMGSIAENSAGGMYPYRTAKTAVNQIGRCLAMDLAKASPPLAVGLIHPGVVQTSLIPKGAPSNVLASLQLKEPSVQGVLQALDALNIETTGQFFHANYGKGLGRCAW